MAIEVSATNIICTECGEAYSRRKGFFSASYAMLHKGIGYIPVCKSCVDKMYSGYLAECHDPKLAVRQMCRKLDLYWSEKSYEAVVKKSTARTMMTQYIQKINNVSCAGKSYDDTLLEEGTLWSFGTSQPLSISDGMYDDDVEDVDDFPTASDDVIAFWGSGYSNRMYAELEQRRAYYMSKFPQGSEIDVGSEALIRQLCNLEVNIAKDSAAGKSIDKSVNSLNTLIGSLNLKPTQQKDDTDASIEKTPFGVWIRRWENQRPIPEPDPEFQDVDGIVRYISVWFLGHLSKMLGIKNSYCKLYEDELAKMRVERPEYEDEDDETMFNDIFSSNESDS